MSYPSNPCQVPVPTTTLFERVFRMNRYSDIVENLDIVFASVFGIVICLVRSYHIITLSRMDTEQRSLFYAMWRFALPFAIAMCLSFFGDHTTNPLLKSILNLLTYLFTALSLFAIALMIKEARRGERQHHETAPLLRRRHRLPSYQSLFFGDQVNIIIILLTILMLINPNTAASLQ